MSYSATNIRIEVFKTHWNHVLKIAQKDQISYDEAEPAVYYTEQMIQLMIEEKLACDDTTTKEFDEGEILEYCIDQDVFNIVYNWSLRCSGDLLEKIKFNLLQMFIVVVEQGSSGSLLTQQMLHPLLRLIQEYSLRSSRQLELALVNLIKLVSVRAANDIRLYQACRIYHQSQQNRLTPFLLDPLVPFIHREGSLGQVARSALLLELNQSNDQEEIAVAVALQSDFCPVLATGLSALYSALPRKLQLSTGSLGQITQFVINKTPQLQHFLGYLQFCCEIYKVTHPLIREAVLHYIYNGFLLPVIGASLNQSSMDEAATATMYLELFIRTIDEPGILKAFLCFVIAESHEGQRIIDSLCNRINSNTFLAISTLSLLSTLVSFYCEDVMFELILRHLIPLQKVSSGDLKSFICNTRQLSRASEQFYSLKVQIGKSHSEFPLRINYLSHAYQWISLATQLCESSWSFNYNGQVVPALEDETTGELLMAHSTPFHGFLDHYSQLLEMRDMSKSNSRYLINDNHSTNTCDDDGQASIAQSFSCPYSPFSQRSNADTITSMKFDQDSQLDKCLLKLRYPSQEDLREQKSHYMISYNIMDYPENEEEEEDLPSNNSYRATYSDLSNRLMKGYDLVHEIHSDNSLEEEDDEITDHAIEAIREAVDLLDEISVEQFQKQLQPIEMDRAKCQMSANVSLNEILVSLKMGTSDVAGNNGDEDERNGGHSCQPIKQNGNLIGDVQDGRQSVMSMQSAITMEDDGLSSNFHLKRISNNNANYSKGKINSSSGNFLYCVLECLESMPTNCYDINLQLANLILILLSYPQPLIRNTIFDVDCNSSLGKTLYRVLNNVRTRLDNSRVKLNISKLDDNYFDQIYTDAKSKLEKRCWLLENNELQNEELLEMYTGLSTTNPCNERNTINKNEKRQFNLLKFLSKTNSNKSSITSPVKRTAREDLEYSRHLNLAYSIIVFNELCEEISAFGKEHSIFITPENIKMLLL